MHIFLLSLIIFNFSFYFANATNSKADVSYGVRYRNEVSKNRVQQKVTLKFSVNFDGGLKLIGVGNNGTSFNSSYDTFYDSSKEDKFDGGDSVVKNFAIRNFYFEKKTSSSLTLQAGALSVEKSLASVLTI